MSWYDEAATEASVLATLRLSSVDADAAMIAANIPAAATAIERHLDRLTPIEGPPPDQALQEVLEAATIRLYHRDAVVATVGGGVGTVDTNDEAFDPLFGLYAELSPFKQQWGLG